MPALDHHRKPYDATTQVKLELFEKYTESWLPTFLKAKKDKVIYIIDYFAGPGGEDANNVPSSPKRIMRAIGKQKANIKASGVKVRVIFNEFDPEKRERLQAFIGGWLKLDAEPFDSVEVFGMDFHDCFEHVLSSLPEKAPSLQILDQTGVKFASEATVERLCRLYRVDFLLFMSSSFFNRFHNDKAVEKRFPRVYPAVKGVKVQVLHQAVARKFAELVCPDRSFIPFALKRGANYMGLVFSSKHPRGADKFLRAAWSLDEHTGQANYVLPERIGVGQIDIFSGERKLSKIENFGEELLAWVAERTSVSNEEVFYYTLNEGFTATHSREALLAAKKAGAVTYASTSPKTRYEAAIGKKQTLVTITHTP